MQYFNFSRLIRKYSRPFTCELKAEGTYDDLGEWVAIRKCGYLNDRRNFIGARR